MCAGMRDSFSMVMEMLMGIGGAIDGYQNRGKEIDPNTGLEIAPKPKPYEPVRPAGAKATPGKDGPTRMAAEGHRRARRTGSSSSPARSRPTSPRPARPSPRSSMC